MGEFLTTAGTAHRLEQIITRAKARLTLLSPYLQVSQVLLERLREATSRGVAVTLVCREDDLKTQERHQLEQIPGLRLRFLANLHAKCFLSEIGVVITSMNLYQHSEKSNREMGAYFDASEPAYAAAVAEVESILAASLGRASHEPERRSASQRSAATRTGSRGYCIRCRRAVHLNPYRPLCVECFQIWAQFENPDYPEQFCHDCGTEWQTTMAHPLCHSCFRSASSF